MTAPAPPTLAADAKATDALVERLFNDCISTLELACVHVGIRLGLYAALADLGVAAPADLAAASACDERYVREWLEQQAVAGLLTVEDASAPASRRRFALPAEHAEVLLQPESPSAMAGFVRLTIGVLSPLPALLEAFRTGEGVAYVDYGADTREGIGAANRPMFTHQLAKEWMPALPDREARLRADPPARVADLACGTGWSSIALARAYPKARVDGLDLDADSIARARANAAEAGVSDRVGFQARDAGDPALAGGYDLVTVFEAVHDMARPVEALRAARALLAHGGAVLVADERVADAFTPPGDEIERLNYGFSVLHCLAVGREEQPSAQTGTVMRADTLHAYAREAGFTGVEVLPIEHDLWRFYRLDP